jgi:stress-induced morphogen
MRLRSGRNFRSGLISHHHFKDNKSNNTIRINITAPCRNGRSLKRHRSRSQNQNHRVTASDTCRDRGYVRYGLPHYCPSFFPQLLIMFTGGCGQAFSAVIVSPQFEKKTTLARHRLVNNALKAEVAAIHAWTPKCYTPEQWEKQRQEGNQAVAPGKDTTGEVVNGTTA